MRTAEKKHPILNQIYILAENRENRSHIGIKENEEPDKAQNIPTSTRCHKDTTGKNCEVKKMRLIREIGMFEEI